MKVKVKLAKDPADYVVNDSIKKMGMLLGARSDDVIWYYKTDKRVSINPQEISILKYKQMLMVTVKDAPEIMKYVSAKKIELEIFGKTQKPKKKSLPRSFHSSLVE